MVNTVSLLYLCIIAGISKTQQKGTQHGDVDAAVYKN
jgi:hypothetical protein